MRTIGTIAAVLLLVMPLVSAEDAVHATVTVTAEATAHPDAVLAYVPDPSEGARATVRILTDIGGAEVAGTIVLEGTAKASRGYALTRVGVYVDNWYMGDATGTTNWSFALDSRLLVDGGHRLTVTAFVIPKLTPTFINIGTSAGLLFSSLNHQQGVVLFDQTMDFTGAASEAWILRLRQDYTGLRVTLSTEALPGSALPAPEAQLAVAYKQTADRDDAPLRTWTATYGILRGMAVVSHAPHPVMQAPGVLALTGVVAGEGRVHIIVEAVPVPHAR